MSLRVTGRRSAGECSCDPSREVLGRGQHEGLERFTAARGAFAGWLVLNRVTDPAEFGGFDDLDYAYDPRTSTLERPVFIKRLKG